MPQDQNETDQRMDLMTLVAHQNNLLEKVDRQMECGLREPSQGICDTGCIICEIKIYLAGN